MSTLKELQDVRFSGKHVVFWYCDDLRAAAKKLAGFLGDCPLVRVYLERNGASVKNYPKGYPTHPKVAWLVGHGDKSDERISSLSGRLYVDIGAVLTWLQDSGYTTVVDTCCQPNQRSQVAGKTKLNYYSSPDDHYVTQITGSPSLEVWWLAQGIKKR